MPEFSEKPSTAIAWAEASGNVTEPGAGTKSAGWQNSAIHPSNFENWLRRENARHIAQLQEVSLREFEYISEAVNALEPGDVFKLRPDFEDYYSFTQLITDSTTAGSLEAICTDGKLVYAADDATILAMNPHDGTEEWNISVASTGPMLDMHTDGDIVAVTQAAAAGAEVYIVTTAGGFLASFNSANSNGGLFCASADGQRQLFFGDLNDLWHWEPSGGFAKILTGIGYIRSICVFDGLIYILSATVAGAGSMRVQAYLAESPWTLQGTVTLNTGLRGSIRTDGEHLYVMYQNTGSNAEIHKLALDPFNTALASPLLWSGTISTGNTTVATVPRIRVDDRFVFCSSGNNNVVVLDKFSGALVHLFAGIFPESFDVDGQFMWLTAGNPNIYRYPHNRGQNLFVVADSTAADYTVPAGNKRKPYNQLALPLTRNG